MSKIIVPEIYIFYRLQNSIVNAVSVVFIHLVLLCQLICQSADLMASLCSIFVRIGVHVNNFSSKSIRPRDMLLPLKDTLFIKDEKLFKACRSVHSSVSQSHLQERYPQPKCDYFNTLTQLSH